MGLIHWDSFFFLVFALLACVFAVAVVVTGNIVRMAAYLVFSLGAVAGLFFLAGADFVGAVQLMVYVGGTLVLLAFGVMLTARGPFASMRTGGGQWVMAILVGGSLLAVLVQTVVNVVPPGSEEASVTGEENAGKGAAGKGDSPIFSSKKSGQSPEELGQSPAAEPTVAPLGMGLLGVRTDRLASGPVSRASLAATPGYLLVFEIISIHLLVVLVGAAYLARAKRRVRKM